MENFQKPKLLPNPFLKDFNGVRPPYNFTPNGMLLPKECQPPPMYGPRGSTIPPRYLPKYTNNNNTNKSNDQGKYEKNKQTFYCEICDIESYSLDKFNEHKREHRKCGVQGCSFYAVQSVITRHIEFQHKTGLYNKLKDVNSPEEIAKWIAERKKRYPIARNIELRQKSQEERFKRGERIEEPKNRFGKQFPRNNNSNKDKKFDRNQKRNRKKNQKKKHREHKPNSIESGEEQKIIKIQSDNDEGKDTINCGVPMFKGTSSISDYSTKKNSKTTNNPLSSMLGMYGSDSEDSTESENEETHENIILSNNEVLDSDEAPEECPTVKEIFNEVPLSAEKIIVNDTELENQNDESNQKRNRKRKSNDVEFRKKDQPQKNKTILDYSKLRKYQPNTMLAKLLEPEIRHERNVLLQCVRFVVQNNFFGIGKN